MHKRIAAFLVSIRIIVVIHFASINKISDLGNEHKTARVQNYNPIQYDFLFLDLQLIATLFNVLNCEHEPPAGTPSFVRSSVESVPKVPGHRSEPLVSSVYGETSLPLRSAVESIPSVP